MAKKTYSIKFGDDLNTVTSFPFDKIPHDKVKALTYEDMSHFYMQYKKVYIIKKTDLSQYVKFWLRNVGETPLVLVTVDIDHDFNHMSFHAEDFMVCKVCPEGTKQHESYAKYGNYMYKSASEYVVLEPLDINHQVRSSQKMFLTLEEMLAAKKEAEDKALAKRTAEKEQRNHTNNGPIALFTPIYEVISVNKATKFIVVKPGDTIQGKIEIVKDDGTPAITSPSSHYVSYVDVYINGKYINKIPMNVYSNIMAFNFQLKQK